MELHEIEALLDKTNKRSEGLLARNKVAYIKSGVVANDAKLLAEKLAQSRKSDLDNAWEVPYEIEEE